MVFVAVVLIGGGWALASVDGQKAVVHFSFDDVSLCLNNIKTKNYDSIFDEPFLNELKRLNEEYDACFSLYAFKDALSNQPAQYAREWQECSSWLKIGLHGDSGDNYEGKGYSDGYNDWNKFVEDIYKMTGSYNSIDRVVRLHNFAGNEEVIRGMKEAKCGARGFLCADDEERDSYFLTQQEKKQIRKQAHIRKKDLLFVSTDMRCEGNIEEGFYNKLDNFFCKNKKKTFTIFTHEWQIYDGVELNKNKSWVEDSCKYFKGKNINFSFL